MMIFIRMVIISEQWKSGIAQADQLVISGYCDTRIWLFLMVLEEKAMEFTLT